MDKALPSRRDELLDLAAAMFAERGLRATTVRDIPLLIVPEKLTDTAASAGPADPATPETTDVP